MREHQATITANILVRPGVRQLELRAPILALSALPGQFGMIRCSPPNSLDPFLRRPYFLDLSPTRPAHCQILVHERGRGSAWLASQPVDATLNIMGPLGHGWNVPSTTSTLLLVSEGSLLPALLLLARKACARGLGVTLLSQRGPEVEVYPPGLLPREVEYQVVERLEESLESYLTWADSAYLSVSHETSVALYWRYERLRKKGFAQGLVSQPLACGGGVCLGCAVETAAGQRLVCHDGPVFDLRELVR